MGGLAGLTALRRLSLDRNRLTALAGAAGGGLACARGLQALSAADNALASLAGAFCLFAGSALNSCLNKHSSRAAEQCDEHL